MKNNSTPHTGIPRKIVVRYICILIIAVIAALSAATVLTGYCQKASLKNKYLDEIRVRLNSIQIELASAVENDNRNMTRNLALEYERLGTIYADASLWVLGSYLDTGEWGTIAQILIGNSLTHEVFQTYDGPLTTEEIDFLECLSTLNEKLLSEICNDSTFRSSKRISIRSFRDILNQYHLETLNDFLAQTESQNSDRYCMFETCPEAFVEYRISASEVETPQQAAEALMEMFLTELKKDDPMRTFTILDIVEVTCHLTGRAEIEQNPEYDWGYAYTDHCTLEENEWLTSCGATVTFQGQLNTNTDTNCGADWLRWGKLRLEDGTYIFTPCLLCKT